MRHVRMAVPALATVALLFLGVSCGGDDDGDGGEESDATLSEAGERGKTIAASSGCAACHGADGQGGVGPGWVGLAGSQVELADGTFVVADDAYLDRAIRDPAAEIRAGYNLRMPTNGLSDDEIADVIAYIHELSPATRDE